jgi:integrase/recombinase XerD
MQDAIARFKRYLEHMSDLAIFSRFVGDVSPREVRPKLIDSFVQAQSRQGLKAATINRRLSAISSFFEFLIDEAEDDGWHNPVRWKRHGIRQGRHLPRDVSDETVSKLLAVVDHPRDLVIFMLMVKASLRVAEVVDLQLSDLQQPDETTGLARLRVRGKGDKDRVVWLTPEVLNQVHNWLQTRPQTDSHHLFLNQHGRPLSTSGVQFRLKQYCERAGVNLTCHQLRHTFARRLVEYGMPVESLARLLGHSDLRTTQLYIDGADPTLRADFLQAMQNLDQQLQFSSRPTSDHFPTPRITSPPDQRPDPVELIDSLGHLAADLPEWLRQEIRKHTIRRTTRWQPHRAKTQASFHFGTLCRISRWLVHHRGWNELNGLQRSDLVAYVGARLEAGIKPRSIGSELTVFRIFWRDLLDQELATNHAILQVKAPAVGDHLPRYLTAAEFQRLEQVVQTETQADRSQDRFNRAWFYLLAHTGLRLSEVLNLRLSDCDFSGQRLRIRSGKGDRDRVIPMTQQLVTLLQDYLMVRESALTDHLLVYKGAAVKTHLIPDRLRRFGHKAQIDPMTPHRLRHTLATFLINQGMSIVSLQKLLGHQDINKTLIYARVHDETMRAQFASAMAQIESIPVPDWPIQLTILADQICDSV